MQKNGEISMIHYRKATIQDLVKIWNRYIAENPEDSRYLRWKEQFISRNVHGEVSTFVIVSDDFPIGEVTLDYHAKGYGNTASQTILADGKTTAYVTALRIRKAYEGNGCISQLMHYMEDYARNKGFKQLTIGVEASEVRTREIYQHWGYTNHILSEMDDGALVLFYAKQL